MVTSDPLSDFLRPLTEHDQAHLDEFDCGDEVMNRFLKRWALEEQSRRLSRTYLIREAARPVSALVRELRRVNPCPGFVTLGAAQVTKQLSGLGREDLRYPVAPALFIGRLGVDSRYQGGGLGRALIRAARLMGFMLPIGCRFLALQVDESNERAIGLYRSEGFWVPEGYEPTGGLLLMLYDLATARPAT